MRGKRAIERCLHFSIFLLVTLIVAVLSPVLQMGSEEL